MSTITFSVNTGAGTWDRDDHAAATMVIERENTRRAALPTPEPPLPLSTAAERRTSYQTIMAANLLRLHLANVEAVGTSNVTVREIVKKAKIATDAQRAAALAALEA